MTSLPLSLELHCTRCIASYGTSSIKCFGHAATHFPQALQTFDRLLQYHLRHLDRIKRTCFHTISKSQTSIIAGLWSAIWNICHCRTIFHSGILVILFCFFTGSGTLDKKRLFFTEAPAETPMISPTFGNRLSTNRTLIDRCLSLCDCRSKSGTSCITTSTTVISRENL